MPYGGKKQRSVLVDITDPDINLTLCRNDIIEVHTL